MRRRSLRALMVPALALALTATACGSDDDQAGGSTGDTTSGRTIGTTTGTSTGASTTGSTTGDTATSTGDSTTGSSGDPQVRLERIGQQVNLTSEDLPGFEIDTDDDDDDDDPFSDELLGTYADCVGLDPELAEAALGDDDDEEPEVSSPDFTRESGPQQVNYSSSVSIPQDFPLGTPEFEELFTAIFSVDSADCFAGLFQELLVELFSADDDPDLTFEVSDLQGRLLDAPVVADQRGGAVRVQGGITVASASEQQSIDLPIDVIFLLVFQDDVALSLQVNATGIALDGESVRALSGELTQRLADALAAE